MKRIHAVAGCTALLMVAIFWLATLVSLLAGSTALTVAVKTAIPYGFLILIPAMMLAGGSGFRLAGRWKTGAVGAKRRRMPVIALNGLLILTPSAVFLAIQAAAGLFDRWYHVVQGVELLAGSINLLLLSLNLRDGVRLRRREFVTGPN